MKIVKISSLGCPSCIIMNKVFNKMKEKYSFEWEEYDIDLDYEVVKNYNFDNRIPTFILYKDGEEVNRLVGEHKEEEFSKMIEENL